MRGSSRQTANKLVFGRASDDAAVRQLASARRILVLGSSGSGKTSLAIRLGHLLRIAPIHLDAWFWKPGWLSTPQAEWRALVESLVLRDSWIMDGTYESTLDLRIPASDAVILIDSSRLACVWRVLMRKATVDDAHRPDAPAGQRIDRDFLRYIWQYPAVTRPCVDQALREHGSGQVVIRLPGPRHVGHLLRQVQACSRHEGDH